MIQSTNSCETTKKQIRFDGNSIHGGFIATPEELAAHLGKGRAKKGMLDGDTDDGELEVGQVSAMVSDIIEL